ncbi:MAG: ABC transporter permease [Caecibacter massiliensis]|nr:ABC transporter permease [Caecibacter massiliensis]
MKRYIWKRLLHLILILIGITFMSFALMHTVSTDTVDILYDQNGGANEAAVAARRASLGLDQDFFTQYASWVVNILHGDMGNSFVSGMPVFTMIMDKLPATIELMAMALGLTLLISLPLGILAAIRKGSIWDQLVRLLSFTGNSLPDFFIAIILLYIFAVKWHVFSFLGTSSSMLPILPALTLAIAMTAKYTRQIRAVFLDELSKEYVQAALSRGLSYQFVITRYVLRSVLAPLLALLAVSAGSLLGGAAIIESIFLWDGIGKLAVDAIMMRDYPIIQAYVIWMSLIYVGVNLLSDIVCRFLDPRIAAREKED